MAANSLIALARETGKYAKTSTKPEVYLIAFSDLAPISGTTEVFTSDGTGLISEINLASASTKFVRYGVVEDASTIKSDYTYNANGSYDVMKELSFTLTNLGSANAKLAFESLFAQPIAAIVQLQTGQFLAFGLNGQMMLKTGSGTVDKSSNGRVITLAGSDVEDVQILTSTVALAVIS